MAIAVLALILSIMAVGGALWAIFKGVDIATKKPKITSLPPGQYRVRKVEGTLDVYDLELVERENEEEKK